MGDDRGLGSAQMSPWREKRSVGYFAMCCHDYRGHRRLGSQRAHGGIGWGFDHYTAAGHHCGERAAVAATRSERTQWPLPRGQRQGDSLRNNYSSAQKAREMESPKPKH